RASLIRSPAMLNSNIPTKARKIHRNLDLLRESRIRSPRSEPRPGKPYRPIPTTDARTSSSRIPNRQVYQRNAQTVASKLPLEVTGRNTSKPEIIRGRNWICENRIRMVELSDHTN